MTPRGSLIVMYHYIREDGHSIPGGIRPLLTSQFEQQLDWLAEHFDIAPPDRFLRDYRQPGARPLCLLTFDDGTRDHAEVAAPILQRRGLAGLFFVLSGPPADGLMPLTHAIHWLLGHDEHWIWSQFERYAVEHLGGLAALGSPADAARIYHYEPPLRGRIKYAANMALPPLHTERLLDQLLHALGRTMPELAGEWFASSGQLLQMHRMGMTLGVHGVSHRSLQSLGAQAIGPEIEHCASYLHDLTGQPPRWWACPFGGSGAAPQATAAMQSALERLEIRAAASTECALVAADTDPLRLPRFDAANLPPRCPAPPEIFA